MFDYNAKTVIETKSELDEKKLPDFSKLAKIESKGVTEACITEAKDETELQKQEQHNVKFTKIESKGVTEACNVTESEGDKKEMGDVMELKKKKPPDLNKFDHNAKVEISKDRMELKE